MRISRAFFLLMMVALLAMPSASFANVFAAHLDTAAGDGGNWAFPYQADGKLDITYRLNEAATAVTIEIFDVSAPGVTVRTLTGTTDWGLNTVQWDGYDDLAVAAPAATYGFRVIAEDTTGHSAWENITPVEPGYAHEIGSCQYYGPRGVTCITDPTSEDFGIIYVSNANPILSGNASAEADRQGVYALYNDMSWYGGTEASAYAAANNNPANLFSTETGYCPWKVGTGLDDNYLWVGNWGTVGLNDEVWVSTGTAGGAATDVLRMGVNGPHRPYQVMSTGTGSGTVLYGITTDIAADGDSYPDLVRWDIGTTLTAYNASPTTLITSLGASNEVGGTMYSLRDFDIGEISGDVYLANRRYAAAEVRVLRMDISGTASPEWSVTGDGFLAISPTVMGQYPYTQDVAVDEGRGRLAVVGDGSSSPGGCCILDPLDGSFIADFSIGGTSGRGCDWDAAGNLITSNTTDEHVRMWSPDDGSNQTTTTYIGNFVVTAQVPVELSVFSTE